MKYKIHSSEIRDFYRERYLKKEKDASFCSMEDIIDADSFIMSINGWGTTNFKTHLIQINSNRQSEVSGGSEDKTAILHFVLKGDTSLFQGKNGFIKMSENTNNIFSISDEKMSHRFRENGQYEYFKVFLPYDFIYSMGHQYPELFEPLIQSLEDQKTLIFPDKHCLTTMEMQVVIEQIKNCQEMGNIAPLYFETKVQELLFLQMQQKGKQKYSSCKRYKHYDDQVNEARNIIESQYQNPPSINQLARIVGMSETVLKASFKLFFGTTIYGYLFDYRMNMARQLLLDTTFTIAEIADRSGYEHASHFTTAFKRKFGVSPLVFRKEEAA